MKVSIFFCSLCSFEGGNKKYNNKLLASIELRTLYIKLCIEHKVDLYGIDLNVTLIHTYTVVVHESSTLHTTFAKNIYRRPF